MEIRDRSFFVGWQLNAKWLQYCSDRLIVHDLINGSSKDIQIQEQGRWVCQVIQGFYNFWNNKAFMLSIDLIWWAMEEEAGGGSMII